MMTMNRATLVGFAGKNPEMRKLPSGDDAAQFSLATTERFRRKTTRWARPRSGIRSWPTVPQPRS